MRTHAAWAVLVSGALAAIGCADLTRPSEEVRPDPVVAIAAPTGSIVKVGATPGEAKPLVADLRAPTPPPKPGAAPERPANPTPPAAAGGGGG